MELLHFIKRCILIGALSVTCLAAMVAAGVSDALLQNVPLWEAGTVWLHRAENMTQSFIDQSFGFPITVANSFIYIAIGLGLLCFALIYRWCAQPMDRVRRLGDVGYIPEHGYTMKEMANLVRQRRLSGDVPPVFPNGWFAIYESRNLKVKESASVSCLGLQLAVFRDESGNAHVVDAYCPHMGANLGVGGQVKGDCIECPFHGWLFRGDDGKCVHVPYSEDKHIPENARIKSHISVEKNGLIYLWYHAEGLEPYWEVPEIEEITRGEWTYRGRSEHHVNAHIEEVPENGSDVAHLRQVHGPFMSAGIDLRYMHSKMWDFIKHTWNGNWEQDPEEKHISALSLLHRLSILGKEIGVLDLEVKAQQIGPGLVHMTFNSVFGSGAFIHTVLPLEPLTQRVLHQIYIQWAVPSFVAKFYLFSEALQVERDIMIWNNKRYVAKPIFVKSNEDGLISKHRRWYSQFYSEHSPRLKMQKDTIDW